MNTIRFTAQSLAAFKKEKAAAEARGEDRFTFEGKEVLCSYAKYVIEYVESQQG